ncbi:MAG: tetratricopeptide repeat protein [Pseudomonadota bacterium]
MSDGGSDSFIEEVSEELRRDRLWALWRRWGPFVIGGVVIVVAAAAGLSWWSAQQEQAAREIGGRLVEAGEAADPAAAFAAAAEGADPGPALVARLNQAAAEARAGREDDALATLSRVTEDADAAPVYRALAAFKMALLQAPTRSPEERAALFDPHAAEGAPFRLLALEQRAAAHLAAGALSAARADAQAAQGDPMATPTLVDRLDQLLILIETAEGGA